MTPEYLTILIRKKIMRLKKEVTLTLTITVALHFCTSHTFDMFNIMIEIEVAEGEPTMQPIITVRRARFKHMNRRLRCFRNALRLSRSVLVRLPRRGSDCWMLLL